MKNTYNKGRYRNGEWAKHLRPELKKRGNRKWRRDTALVIREEMDMDGITPTRRRKSAAKNITVKIKMRYYGNITSTRTTQYRSMKDAENAMRRSQVVWAVVVE